jgi:serine/threonine protein kinase
MRIPRGRLRIRAETDGSWKVFAHCAHSRPARHLWMSDFISDRCSAGAGTPLGCGGFSNVRKVRDSRTGNWTAVKTIDPEHFTAPGFLREVEALVMLNHPCVLRIIGWVTPSQSWDSEIQTEIAENGSLDRLLDNAKYGAPFPFWTPTGKAIMICGIALGMRFVHSRHYIHCDLKPSNILINARGESLISDFGTVRSESYDATLTPGSGSAHYAAPEMFQDRTPCTAKVDVFSFGSIVYEILTGRAVFSPSTVPFEVIRALRKREVAVVPESCGSFMQNLIGECRATDPDARDARRVPRFLRL